MIDEVLKLKSGNTLIRWRTASQDKALDPLHPLVLLETHSHHLLRVLEKGSVSTNLYLRRLHNFALDMSWLPWPVLPKKNWPVIRFKDKRAITRHEHDAIVAREPNPEWRAFYELLWATGGSQSDVASLTAEHVDRDNRILSYPRAKTASVSRLRYGPEVEGILAHLPRAGRLFPRLALLHEKHRAKLFRRRCLGLRIHGVSLHSYRYAWAERARRAGYPERFAQEALGHNSKAVHRAYARQAKVLLPSLESFEKAQAGHILPFPEVAKDGPGRPAAEEA